MQSLTWRKEQDRDRYEEQRRQNIKIIGIYAVEQSTNDADKVGTIIKATFSVNSCFSFLQAVSIRRQWNNIYRFLRRIVIKEYCLYLAKYVF